MNSAGLEQIADELCRLLQEQVEVVAGRTFNDFTDEELAGYEKRKARLLVLRAELGKFVKPT